MTRRWPRRPIRDGSIASHAPKRLHWSPLSALLVFAFAWHADGHMHAGSELLSPDRTPLRTRGRYIVDNLGQRIKWACVNWYGAYSTTHVVGGLEIRPMSEIVNRIVDLGFNCVRAMYSLQGYVDNPVVKDEDVRANPELKGKRFLELFDLSVKAMTDAGLMVIINNHISKSGWCCHYSQDEGLWYVPGYPEEVWIESLVFFAERYKNNPMVVGHDLRNEVHDFDGTHLSWGDGDPKTDWALAATKAGNAVLEVAPDSLIIVMAMCFGMDLRRMKDAPITLNKPNRVIYQTHNYLEYQIFDNLAKQVAPWAQIRDTVLMLIFIFLFVLWCLRAMWANAGYPGVRKTVVVVSCAFWIGLLALIGLIISSIAVTFGNKFCNVSVETDVVPWMYGAAATFAVCMATVSTGFVIIWRFPRKVLAKSLEGLGPGSSASSSSNPPPTVIPRQWPPKEQPDIEATIFEQPHHSPSLQAETQSRFCSCGAAVAAFRRMIRFARKLDRRALGFRAKRVTTELSDLAPQQPWDLSMLLLLQLAVVSICMVVVFFFVYVWAHILPTYWWMERHMDGLWGFALEEGHPWTAPVWVGEFGADVRGQYWMNFMRYLAIRDVDFAYWAVNGIKWAEGYIDSASGEFTSLPSGPRWENETFGILDHDYKTVRHTWLLLDLQGIMQSPASWRPDGYPCSYALDPSCGTK